MGTERINLPKNYAQCHCGQKLTKKTRFAIKLEQPKSASNAAREKQNKPMLSSALVVYCCEVCYMKLEEHALDILNIKGWFFYYEDSYKV